LLEYVTLAWMTVEAVIAIGAGVFAHSLVLMAFGIDSVIELASAPVLCIAWPRCTQTPVRTPFERPYFLVPDEMAGRASRERLVAHHQPSACSRSLAAHAMANNMRAITTVTTAMKARSRVSFLVPPIERALNMYAVWELYTKQLRVSKPNH
jgi:hypothetical protein